MNELRLFLESILFEIKAQNHNAAFKAEKLDSLLKPWPVHVSTTTVTTCGPDLDSNQDELDKSEHFHEDVDKINTMLKHARLVRNRQEQASSKTIEKSRPASGNTKNSLEKNTAKKLPNRKKPGFNREFSSSSATKSRSLVDAQKKLLSGHKDTKSKIPQASAGNVSKVSKPVSLPDTDLKQPVVAKTSLVLEEVLKERLLSSKYVKLRNMHDKLRTTVMNCDREASKSETTFISKLAYSANFNSNMKNILTVDALNLSMAFETSEAEYLTNSLKYKIPYSDDDTSAVALYFQKLVYKHLTDAVSDLENRYLKLRDSLIIRSTVSESEHRNIFNNTLHLSSFPCKYLSFEKEIDVVQNVKSRNEISWINLNLSLKRRLHQVYMDLLQQYIDLKDENSLDRDAISFLTSAFGLLSKTYRCSINPAVVKIV